MSRFSFLRFVSALSLTALLASCGGGSAGTSLFSDGTSSTTSTAKSVEVLASATTVGTGADQITVTANVKDSGNAALASQTVTFQASTGTLTSVSSATDKDGVATATFSAGEDKSNRSVTISVSTGSVKGSISLPIQGTKLTFSGASTAALGSRITLTVKAADSKGVVITGQSLTVASSLGNGLSASTVTTDSNGQASFDYQATNAGTDTVTVQGLGASATQSVTVSGEDFAFVSPSADTATAVNSSVALTVRYRKNGVPQAGTSVRFASTVGTLTASSATTDANGLASVSLTSSFAASATVSAVIGSGSTQSSATLPLSFVASSPARLVLQLSRTALAPNTAGSTSNQATAVAKVVDANGNPVPNVNVNFNQDADPSGGRLLQATATTDSVGEASVSYASGATSTQTNAVVLRGTVASSSAITATATLTVNQGALFITLGTGNTITNSDVDTYEKTWTAYVSDSTGARVSGVPLTIKIVPTHFGKGVMVWSDSANAWVYDYTISGDKSPEPPRKCVNEDWLDWPSLTGTTSLNGVKDSGEDVNQDGQLTPGNVVSLTQLTYTTDANGSATITFRYPENVAPWIRVRLTATAIVAGSESVKFAEFWLPKLSTDFSDKTITPAGWISPYGKDVSTCGPSAND